MEYTCVLTLNKIKAYLAGAAVIGFDFETSPLEEYRSEEDGIKNALMSAQKRGDASVREARHKAEIILKDAEMKAARLVESAEQEAESHTKELQDLEQKVTDFRARVLAMYKEHLTLLTALPAQKKEEKQPEPEPSFEESPEEDRPLDFQGSMEPVPFEEEEELGRSSYEDLPPEESFQFSPAHPFDE